MLVSIIATVQNAILTPAIMFPISLKNLLYGYPNKESWKNWSKNRENNLIN